MGNLETRDLICVRKRELVHTKYSVRSGVVSVRDVVVVICSPILMLGGTVRLFIETCPALSFCVN